MSIFNNYYQSFNFKLRDSHNVSNTYYQLSQKNTSMTIHNVLLLTSLNLIFFFFSPIFYKTTFYNILYMNPFFYLFLSKKTFSKIL